MFKTDRLLTLRCGSERAVKRRNTGGRVGGDTREKILGKGGSPTGKRRRFEGGGA